MSRTARRTTRTGFTLVELLVVMAIIGILVSLLMPAIQSVRQRAKMTECENQLHNILIACHNYEGVHGVLPSAFITAPNQTTTYLQANFSEPLVIHHKGNTTTTISSWALSSQWTWQSMITPQMEATTIQPDFRLAKDAPINLDAIQTPIKSYICPSADLPSVRPGGFAYGTYRANVGTTATNGPMYENSGVSLDQISRGDGTAHTILCGDSLFGFWGDGTSCCARFNPQQPQRNWNAYWSRDVGGTMEQYTGWGTWHGDSAVVAFCDNSVRPIALSTDLNVLYAWSTRNGNERIK